MQVSFDNFCNNLARAQLKNSPITEDGKSGRVRPDYKPQLLSLTNKGLIDITTKKKLFEEVAVLTFVDGQNIYELDTSDTGDYADLVKVLEIIDSNENKYIPNTYAQIKMPSPDSLRFSTTFMGTYGPSVDVVFQVHHPEIVLDDSINLPANLFEALELYVAGLYLSHIGGDDNTRKGDSYYGLYLKMLNDDTLNNSSNTSELTDDDVRFYDRGFV